MNCSELFIKNGAVAIDIFRRQGKLIFDGVHCPIRSVCTPTGTGVININSPEAAQEIKCDSPISSCNRKILSYYWVFILYTNTTLIYFIVRVEKLDLCGLKFGLKAS